MQLQSIKPILQTHSMFQRIVNYKRVCFEIGLSTPILQQRVFLDIIRVQPNIEEQFLHNLKCRLPASSNEVLDVLTQVLDSYIAFSCAFQNTLLVKVRSATSCLYKIRSICKSALHSSNTMNKFTKVRTLVFVVAHEHSIGNYITASVPSPTTSHFTIMGYSHGSD